MITKIDLGELLAKQNLFRHLSRSQLDALQREVIKIELDKSAMLFRQNDVAEGSYLVVFGLIKLSIPSSQGNDKVLELIRPGQHFGEAMMFLDESYPFYAEALEQTLLLRIPRHSIDRLLEQSPQFARHVMTGLSQRLLGLIHHVERYSLQNATQRVIDYLLHSSMIQSSTDVKLELKKNLVASLLNVSPETLSRVLHQLTDEQLISVNGSVIRIGCCDALKSYQYGSAILN